MNKDRILLIGSLLALIASGVILYSSFGNSLGFSLPFMNQPTPVVPAEQQSIQNVQLLDQQIQRSLNNLGPNGLWQVLLNNQQYQKLSGQALVPVEIGEHARTNPFDPVNTPTTNTANGQQ